MAKIIFLKVTPPLERSGVARIDGEVCIALVIFAFLRRLFSPAIPCSSAMWKLLYFAASHSGDIFPA